ncbi:MAG: hypothetical protein ACP5MD_02710 [Verrucomicrobiia bacterium]
MKLILMNLNHERPAFLAAFILCAVFYANPLKANEAGSPPCCNDNAQQCGTESSCCGSNASLAQAAQFSTTSPEELRDKWGVAIASLRLSAQGYFVDFRYKVLDPQKAAPLARAEWKPHLIDQATGRTLGVPTTPKLGPLRQTSVQLLEGRTYFVFFGNSRGIVKHGSKVTVVIGDCRIENLTVE